MQLSVLALAALCTRQSLAYSLGAEICAGCAGGVAKAVALHPLDTITTTLEVSRQGRRPTSADGARGPSLSTRSALQGLATQPRALYRGLIPVVVGALPYAVLFHTAFYLMESLLLDAVGGGELRAALASAFASLVGVLVGVPCELLKHRAQARALLGQPAQRLRRAARDVTRADGWRGLYVGTLPTLVRNIP
jgi:hypothetical protein